MTSVATGLWQAARSPLELFVRVRGQDCTAETVALYDILARLASLALQYGCPVQTIGAMLRGVQVEPAGLVTGHPTMHFCSSLPDAIGQHLLSLCPDASPQRSDRCAAMGDLSPLRARVTSHQRNVRRGDDVLFR